MHAAQASAERAALIHFQFGPFPHAQIFGNGVAIISDDLEGVGVLGDKSIVACAHENGQNVSRLDGKPLSAHMSRCKMVMQVSLKLEGVGRVDPPKQPQVQGVASLEAAFARFYVLRHPDLDRGASIFVFTNELDRHVALLAALPEPVEQDLDHLLI